MTGIPQTGEPRTHRLGDILVINRLITSDQLADALAAQAGTGKRLGQIMIERGFLNEDDLAWALSTQLGYPYVYLTPDLLDDEAARLLPEPFLRERCVLPILKYGGEMTLAMADPTDERAVTDAAARTGLRVSRALAIASNLDEMLDHLFSRRAGPRQPVATEVQYLHFHLAQAVQQGATEIHLDPSANGDARLRYRLQGVLVDHGVLPTDLHAAILRHLRGLTAAGDAPAVTASALLPVGSVQVHLTMAFVPTVAGPAATISIYPSSETLPDLAPLGISDETVQPILDRLQAARGALLVGCGDRWLRATVIHALIARASPGAMWTLEAVPIYRRPGLNQTVVASRDTIPEGVHTLAEAGADLIAVDDASRREALIACCEVARRRTALIGHPQDDVVGLLSQTVDAVGPALVSSILRGILAVRAVRLLCPRCKEPSPQRAFVRQGCEACSFTGFRGVRALVECWVPDQTVIHLIRTSQLAEAFERVARTVEMQMRDQGLSLVQDGLTSLDEVTRVLEGTPWT